MIASSLHECRLITSYLILSYSCVPTGLMLSALQSLFWSYWSQRYVQCGSIATVVEVIVMVHVQCCMCSVAFVMLHVQYCMCNVACAILHVQCCMCTVACAVLHVQCCRMLEEILESRFMVKKAMKDYKDNAVCVLLCLLKTPMKCPVWAPGLVCPLYSVLKTPSEMPRVGSGACISPV